MKEYTTSDIYEGCTERNNILRKRLDAGEHVYAFVSNYDFTMEKFVGDRSQLAREKLVVDANKKDGLMPYQLIDIFKEDTTDPDEKAFPFLCRPFSISYGSLEPMAYSMIIPLDEDDPRVEAIESIRFN